MPSPAGRDSAAIVPPHAARLAAASVGLRRGNHSGIAATGVERLTSVGVGHPGPGPQTGLHATLW
jgi:hypothetical protein